MSETRTVPLSAIVGRSRYNVRPEGDPAGMPAMAASIRTRGLITALLVRQADDPDLYEVDDGGCRWDAMRHLVDLDAAHPPEDRAPWTWNSPVKVEVVNGDAGEARARSLAANIIRRQMHPVEECEAFADLAGEGVAIETIAADFGVTPRFVRQRLKLDALSPRVRQAWRNGKVSAAAAEVLTGAPDHAAQDAILDRFPAGLTLAFEVDQVKNELRGKTLSRHSPETIYVGLDSYVEAGGRLDEQLFGDETRILDPLLMKRLARQAMMDEGIVFAERYGYGSVLVRDELSPDEPHWKWGQLDAKLSEAESVELQRLDASEQAEIEALPEDADEAIKSAIDDRYCALRDAVEHRATERGSTAAQRLAAVVFVWLGHDGKLVVDLGRTRPTTNAEAPPPPSARPFAATALPPASSDVAVEPVKPPGKALVALMDEAMSKAYAAIVAERPYLAMLLATAALTCRANYSALRIRTSRRADVAATAEDFCEAAARALDGLDGRTDLMVRFARAVADTIDVAPASSYNGARHGLVDAAGLAELMAVYGDRGYNGAMVAALDYRAYFEAASKSATLAAIDACGGFADARKLGKLMLVEAAATLCRDKGWLPPELREPDTLALRRSIDTGLPRAMPSLADAMASALAADGADDDEALSLVFDPQTPDEALSLFIAAECTSGGHGHRVKAKLLFDAFQARSVPAAAALITSMRDFGTLMAQAGYDKTRLSGGVHYLGLALKPAAPLLQQAAE